MMTADIEQLGTVAGVAFFAMILIEVLFKPLVKLLFGWVGDTPPADPVKTGWYGLTINAVTFLVATILSLIANLIISGELTPTGGVESVLTGLLVAAGSTGIYETGKNIAKLVKSIPPPSRPQYPPNRPVP